MVACHGKRGQCKRGRQGCKPNPAALSMENELVACGIVEQDGFGELLPVWSYPAVSDTAQRVSTALSRLLISAPASSGEVKK